MDSFQYVQSGFSWKSLMQTSFSRTYLINAQISRIVAHSIGFIGCLVIMYYELKHRRALSTNYKLEHRWLLLFAMLTIFSSTTNQIFNISYAFPSTVISICSYTAHLTLFLWFTKLIFLGLFQIQRLQFLFKNDNESDVKLPLMFKLLYGGSFMSFAAGMSFLFAITVTDYHQYGCLWTYGKVGSIINLVWIFVYLCWDGSTLILYLFKLSRYRRAIKAISVNPADGNKRVYNPIKFILSKIVLLTLIYEGTTCIVATLAFIVHQTENEYILIVFYIVGSIDTFICGLMVYLMQKHNEKHYYTFLLLLDKLNFTFCCKRLSRDANKRSNANNSISEIKGTETKTGNTVTDNSDSVLSTISISPVTKLENNICV
eukprot:16708_1